MITAPFDYTLAESVEHATGLLAEHGDEAKLLAGGHSLIPMMKYRLATPTMLARIRAARSSLVRLPGSVPSRSSSQRVIGFQESRSLVTRDGCIS